MSEAINVRAYVEPAPAPEPEVERVQRPDFARDAAAALLSGTPGRTIGALMLAAGVLLLLSVLRSLYARYRRDWCDAPARRAIGRDDVLL